MKILQVNKFFYRKGGSETYLFSLIDGLSDHGIDVAEFSMQDLKNSHSDYEKYFVSNIDYDDKNLLEKIKIGCQIFYSIEARKKISNRMWCSSYSAVPYLQAQSPDAVAQRDRVIQ